MDLTRTSRATKLVVAVALLALLVGPPPVAAHWYSSFWPPRWLKKWLYDMLSQVDWDKIPKFMWWSGIPNVWSKFWRIITRRGGVWEWIDHHFICCHTGCYPHSRVCFCRVYEWCRHLQVGYTKYICTYASLEYCDITVSPPWEDIPYVPYPVGHN